MHLGDKKPKEFLSFLREQSKILSIRRNCACLLFKIFIYLAAPGLSCGMQESLVVAHGI